MASRDYQMKFRDIFKWLLPTKIKYYDYEITLDDEFVEAFCIPVEDVAHLDNHIYDIMYGLTGDKVTIEHCVDGWGQDIIKVRSPILPNNWWLITYIGTYNES